jgi:hypothetical protein
VLGVEVDRLRYRRWTATRSPAKDEGARVRDLEKRLAEALRREAEALEHVRQIGRVLGFRGLVTVPMLREGEVVGAISVDRREPGRFSDAEVQLLKTFADQAVIAIENVRLFRELEQKNRALTQAYAQVSETLEQQIATGDILRVISNSPTDVQPIFDAIVKSASRLSGGEYAIATRYDGELLHLVAQYNPRPGTADETARFFPQIPDRGTSFVARALVDAAVVHVTNVEDEDLDPMVRGSFTRSRTRAVSSKSPASTSPSSWPTCRTSWLRVGSVTTSRTNCRTASLRRSSREYPG